MERSTAAAGTLLAGPVLALVVTALLQAGFGRKGAVPFVLAFAAVVHAGVVLALRQVVVALAGICPGNDRQRGIARAWFPGLDASSPLARALGFVDLFVIWWIVLLGIAAAMLYGKRRRNLVFGFLGAVPSCWLSLQRPRSPLRPVLPDRRRSAMTELTPSADVQPRFPNLLQRMVGVIFSPRATYQAIAKRPVILGPLARRAPAERRRHLLVDEQ